MREKTFVPHFIIVAKYSPSEKPPLLAELSLYFNTALKKDKNVSRGSKSHGPSFKEVSKAAEMAIDIPRGMAHCRK